MPTYRYRDEQGELVEVFMTMAELGEREHDGILEHEGKTLTRDLAAEHSGFVGVPGAWPMRAEHLTMEPEERKGMMEHCRRAGVPTFYDKSGAPIFTSRGHYQRWQKAFGARPKNSFTSNG